MPALKLNDVPARVAAWHNRHPLARRIDPSQVHSIGGLGLPFASDQPAPAVPPTLTELVDPAPADPGRADTPTPDPAGDAPQAPGDGQAPDPATPAASTEPDPTPPPEAPEADPITEDAAADAPKAAGSPAADAVEAGETATGTPDAGDDAVQSAEPELVLGLEEPAPADSPAPAEAPTAPADTPTDTPANAPDQAPDSTEPTTTAPPVTPDGPPPAAPEADAPPLHPPAPAAPAAPLAARLEAARAAARHGQPDDAATAARRPWWQRFWPWPRRQRAAGGPPAPADQPGPPLGHAGALRPLFDRDLLAPLAPRRIAQWLRRHGAHEPLAPAGWPKRLERPNPSLLAATRSGRLRHALTLHMLTAAIDDGPRRLRVLIDADGQVLGPRLLSPWRLLAAAGAVTLATGLIGWAVWQNTAQTLHRAPGDAALAAATTASGAASDPAAGTDDPAADSPVATAAAASAVVAHAVAASAPQHVEAAASEPESQAPVADPAPAAAPGHHVLVSPEVLLSGRWTRSDAGAAGTVPPPAAASAVPAVPAAGPHADAPGLASAPATAAGPAPLMITTVPPPRFPERRASGPLARIRPELSAEARQLARQQSEAARAAARGEPPPVADSAASATPAASDGKPAPAAPNARYAVVTEGAKERDTAEAQLAQMMSVRARLPAPGPAFTELLQLDGRWRAAQWPFANEAEAARAREMLTVRGLKAEVVVF